MTQMKDITGQRFGRLVALKVAGKNKYGRYLWLCKCDCGNEKIAAGNDLRRGATKSCGCFQKESRITSNIKHGLYYTRLHRIWTIMKARCYNKNNNRFHCYGARGISVCREWKDDFTAFYDWAISNGYEDSLTIDRIDVNKGYFPENCRWTTNLQQSRNRRTNRYITIKGETKCISEWCELFGIQKHSIYDKSDGGVIKCF